MNKRQKLIYYVFIVLIVVALLLALDHALNNSGQVHAQTAVSEAEEQPNIEFQKLKEFNQYHEYRMIDYEEGVVCYITIDANTNPVNSGMESAPSQFCLHRIEK